MTDPGRHSDLFFCFFVFFFQKFNVIGDYFEVFNTSRCLKYNIFKIVLNLNYYMSSTTLLLEVLEVFWGYE